MVYTYNNAVIQRTQAFYEPTPLLINDYIDTVYSSVIYDYDPKLLKDMWSDIHVIYNENDKLYLYKNKPITVNKG